ncbi:Chitobiosyldiphosphodolichol beta-mannosyltransferase [Thelohanellus kitauei]|uniref:Chitobiosyldiphosphodolichol beta-mannosyltransferase n=1 Tax=Thelohanellus kitauei TaxID=669202 RepID=A0A0C2N5R5_THEKT|nr:Chitobiosyldiphosphodolichol beta-mannosyltransferase [Thelohanellus kitauei]
MSGIAIIICLVFLFIVVLVLKKKEKSNVVLVVGDICRSPRMLYHTNCMSKFFKNLILVGYCEKSYDNLILKELEKNPSFRIKSLYTGIKYWVQPPRVILLPLKLLFQTYTLGLALTQTFPIHTILVQNPPSVPTLVLVSLARELGLIKCFVIDWHNYGHTLLDFSGTIIMKVYVRIYRL